MAGSDASEGQAVWQPGGAEVDSRLREGNRHLHLAYDEEEEPATKFPYILDGGVDYCCIELSSCNKGKHGRIHRLFHAGLSANLMIHTTPNT